MLSTREKTVENQNVMGERKNSARDNTYIDLDQLSEKEINWI